MNNAAVQVVTTIIQMSLIVALILGGGVLKLSTEIIAIGVAAISGGSDVLANKLGRLKQ